MPKGRLPNPQHITRYEHEDLNGTRGRSSHYSHDIKVPPGQEERVQDHGKVVIERTEADWARERLADAERVHSSGWRMSPEAIERYRADLDNTDPFDRRTWTVGHIVWPDDEPGPCPECPHGRAQG